LRIVTIRKPGRPKSRSSTLSPAISARRRPEAKVSNTDRAVADRERSRWWPLEFERRGEPLGGNRRPAVVAAGVFAPGALEQIAHHPPVGRRREAGCPVKEPDRRRPRAQGLGGRAAVAQRPQEGRDERRVRAERFKAERLGVGGELPPARLVAAAGVRGGGAGDEVAGGGDGAGDSGEAEGGTSITLRVIRGAGERALWC
jgi:hypothetical protein